MTDFNPVKVLDKRLNCHSDISYAVFEGGQNVNLQRFPSQSQTVNQHVYNIVTPNQNSIIDRRAYWRASIQFQITATTPSSQIQPSVTNYKSIVNYGVTDALAPFPLHSLTQTMQNTINSNTLSLNVSDILPVLLRFYDAKDLEKYSSYTPTLLDNFGTYAYPVVQSNSNPLAGIGNENYDLLKPRGSFILDYLSYQNPATGAITPANAFLSSAGGAGYAPGTQVTLYGQVSVTEPILMPIWLVGNNKMNSQGFYGTENLSFVMNMISNGNRFWRSGGGSQNYSDTSTFNTGWNPALPFTCTINSYTNCSIDLIFLTPKPSLLLSSKNTVPLLVYERYITASAQVLPPCLTSQGQPIPNPAGAQSITLSSNNLVFNQIPDKVLVWVRKALGKQTSSDADYYIPISGINLQWNNVSGIFSSFTQQALWAMSRDNGCQIGWESWAGFANYQNNLATNNSCNYTPMVGSVFCAAFGKDINLGESFLAPGSIGNFNFQINVSVYNNQNIQYAAGDLELVIVSVNSGIASFDRGVTSTYTALLSKEMVLNTTSQPADIDNADLERMIGTGFFDDMKSGVSRAFKTLRPYIAPAGNVLSMSSNPEMKTVGNVLKMVGGRKPAMMNRLA